MALNFQKPDRVPRKDGFWPEFEEVWRLEKGLDSQASIDDFYGMDIHILIPDETPFPSQARVVESNGQYEVIRTGWGVLQRAKLGAMFYEDLDVPLVDKRDMDKLAFESPLLDLRYDPKDEVEAIKARYCGFVKTGGPYLRTSNLRGGTQWLVDLAEDPAFALELAMRVTQHITAVGLEAIRRYDLYDTGIWFYDDMGSNLSPMFSPKTFEKVFYPCYKWMCDQYRAAGVAYIVLHCDGNLEAILDPLIDAGIQALNPIEPKAGMDPVVLRERYGTALALVGGLDNAHILTKGTLPEIEAHVLRVLELGREGGLVIGAHSIGPDVPVSNYDFVHQVIRKWDQSNA